MLGGGLYYCSFRLVGVFIFFFVIVSVVRVFSIYLGGISINVIGIIFRNVINFV